MAATPFLLKNNQMEALKQFIAEIILEARQPQPSELTGATIRLPQGVTFTVKKVFSNHATDFVYDQEIGAIRQAPANGAFKAMVYDVKIGSRHREELSFFLSGDRDLYIDFVDTSNQNGRVIYDITDATITPAPEKEAGIATGIKKNDLIVYAIHLLGGTARQKDIVNKVSELDGKPSSAIVFTASRYRQNPLLQYITKNDDSTISLTQAGKELANQVSAQLTATSSLKAVKPLNLIPYYATSARVITTKNVTLAVLDRPLDTYRFPYNSEHMVDAPSGSKTLSVKAETILNTVVENDTLMCLITDSGVRLTASMFDSENITEFCVPINLPENVIRQAEERSVYLDGLQEAGRKVPQKELKELQLILKHARIS